MYDERYTTYIVHTVYMYSTHYTVYDAQYKVYIVHTAYMYSTQCMIHNI